MARKKVNFLATKYKDKPALVNFYTNEGRLVSFDAVKKTQTKQAVSFYVNSGSGKKKIGGQEEAAKTQIDFQFGVEKIVPATQLAFTEDGFRLLPQIK